MATRTKHIRRLIIGDIPLSVRCPTLAWSRLLDRRYHAFRSNATAGDARIAIASPSSFTERPGTLRVAGGRKGWEIARGDFHSFSDPDLSTTTADIRRNKYVFDSWLRVFFSLRSLREPGFLVHGSGIEHRGKTHLFAGPSGSGKSTMIKILGRESALSDELVYVSLGRGRPRGFATPFWGELASDGADARLAGPLAGIYFLERGPRLALRRLEPGEAIVRLMACILFFSRDPEGMERLLAAAAKTLELVPARRLSFSLDTRREDILAALEHIE